MSSYKGFSTVQLKRPARSYFDLSHEKRLSTRMGRLTPIFVSETLPDDTFKMNSEVMIRLAPLIAPIMHRVNVYVHFFFVPNRLLWKDWENFITNGRLGTETPPVPPNVGMQSVLTRNANYLDIGSNMDYLGFPNIPDASQASYAGRNVDLMPIAAFYKCWYDYYRDRNYVADDSFLPLASGTTVDNNLIDTLFYPRFRDWQKDYFTSSLPWTQRGNEVLMPLQGSGVVTYLPTSKLKITGGADVAGDTLVGRRVGIGASGDMIVGMANNSTGGQTGRVENIQSVSLTSSDVSINDLRRAVRLQEWMERNALAGSRYVESLWAHFGRKSSDGRLQRAEYLGGGKVTVKISEVVTTAYSEDDAAQTVPPANLAGHGISFGNTNRFTYNCEEHGFVIGLMSVMPTSAYMQGAPRMFFGRNTFLDYPWPTFAHLGEQEVFKYELYADPTNITADRTTQPVFGYQSRYADWKYIHSSTHGDLRTSLDFWHLTRKFASSPVIGAAFCRFEDSLQDRVFNVSGVDTLWTYIYNNVSVVRSLPYYGTPML